MSNSSNYDQLSLRAIELKLDIQIFNNTYHYKQTKTFPNWSQVADFLHTERNKELSYIFVAGYTLNNGKITLYYSIGEIYTY